MNNSAVVMRGGVGVLVALAVVLTACASFTPEVALDSATSVIDIAAGLPNLTPPERAWLGAAATGTACASQVLAGVEPVGVEATAILTCFAGLPVVPTSDQPYIGAAISAVHVFIDLFLPPPAPQKFLALRHARNNPPVETSEAVKANTAAHKLNPAGRALLTSRMNDIAVRSAATREKLHK